MTTREVIEMYGGRWNIKTTFQELRAHLGLETTRGWSKMTVLRMAPSLILLYTIVVTFYDAMPDSSSHLRFRFWQDKESITFSDMIISIRELRAQLAKRFTQYDVLLDSVISAGQHFFSISSVDFSIGWNLRRY